MSRLTISCAAIAIVALSALGVTLASSNNFGDWKIKPGGLTAPQAKRVLLLVLEHEHYKMANRDMVIDGPWVVDKKGTPFRAGYYDFGLIYNNPGGAASNVLGQYTVNRFTGDVWETEECKRYRFPSLTKVQNEISAKTNVKMKSEDAARDELGC